MKLATLITSSAFILATQGLAASETVQTRISSITPLISEGSNVYSVTYDLDCDQAHISQTFDVYKVDEDVTEIRAFVKDMDIPCAGPIVPTTEKLDLSYLPSIKHLVENNDQLENPLWQRAEITEVNSNDMFPILNLEVNFIKYCLGDINVVKVIGLPDQQLLVRAYLEPTLSLAPCHIDGYIETENVEIFADLYIETIHF